MSEVPEVRSATLLVFVRGGGLRPRQAEDRDDLRDLELAFWPSGYVVWAEPAESGSTQHRGAPLSPSVVQRLSSRTAAVLEEHGGLHGVPLDTSLEEVWIRRSDTVRGVTLWSVFAERDSKWDGRLPGIGYPSDPPVAPSHAREAERYPLDKILELEKEREPRKVELYRAWHSIKDELRAALPKDGELVDRAKLATLGLR